MTYSLKLISIFAVLSSPPGTFLQRLSHKKTGCVTFRGVSSWKFKLEIDFSFETELELDTDYLSRPQNSIIFPSFQVQNRFLPIRKWSGRTILFLLLIFCFMQWFLCHIWASRGQNVRELQQKQRNVIIAWIASWKTASEEFAKKPSAISNFVERCNFRVPEIISEVSKTT